jgi:hypothetical protein
MLKSVVTLAAALTILSLGSLVSAQAGGATSAPSKYNGVSHSAKLSAARNHQLAAFSITEFSSSSAKSSAPKR